FTLSRSAPPRTPHSFPTRRSSDLLTPAVFVPESLTGMELLQNFRSSSAQLVIVIDEYGEVQGMVTLRDVIEAITGEFHELGVERSEEHTSELQSRENLVCRLLLEK